MLKITALISENVPASTLSLAEGLGSQLRRCKT